MDRLFFSFIVILVILTGCAQTNDTTSIIKVVDFELSPDENRVVFSALTPVGNMDIWVVDIDGKNLRKLTFKDNSPSNRVARFFKRYKWRNFFKIDMCSPRWTREGRIVFWERLTKHGMWGQYTVSLKCWTIRSNGTDKRYRTDKDEVIRKNPSMPINRYKKSEYSQKNNKTIFRKNGTLWFLNDGEAGLRKLIEQPGETP